MTDKVPMPDDILNVETPLGAGYDGEMSYFSFMSGGRIVKIVMPPKWGQELSFHLAKAHVHVTNAQLAKTPGLAVPASPGQTVHKVRSLLVQTDALGEELILTPQTAQGPLECFSIPADSIPAVQTKIREARTAMDQMRSARSRKPQ